MGRKKGNARAIWEPQADDLAIEFGAAMPPPVTLDSRHGSRMGMFMAVAAFGILICYTLSTSLSLALINFA